MRDSLIASTLAAVTFVLLTPFATFGVDWHHDGTMLKTAMDIKSGQVLFRDTAFVYGALTAYLHAFALWIYPSLIAMKLLVVGAYALSSFFTYLAWRSILPRSLAVLSSAIFFLFIPNIEFGTFMPWSSVYAMMFQSAALYSLTQIIAGSRVATWGAVLGATTAAVFWCRQPVGALLAVALVVIGFALRRAKWTLPDGAEFKALQWALRGFVVINLLLLASVVVTGALDAWWYQNFVWPRYWASQGLGGMAWRDHAWQSLRPRDAAALSTWLIAVALPAWFAYSSLRLNRRWVAAYYALLVGAIVWRHETLARFVSIEMGGWALVILAVVIVHATISVFQAARVSSCPVRSNHYTAAALGGGALASLAQYFPVADRWHIAWALAPAIGVFVYAWWRWTGWRTTTLFLVLAGCFLPAAVSATRSVRTSFTQQTHTLTEPVFLKGMRVTAAQAEIFSDIYRAVQPVLRNTPRLPGVLLGDNALLLCFAANLENPSPFYFRLPGLIPAAEEEKRFRFIDTARPLLFFCSPKRDLLNETLRTQRYTSLAYLPAIDVEIAAPDEAVPRPPVAHPAARD